MHSLSLFYTICPSYIHSPSLRCSTRISYRALFIISLPPLHSFARYITPLSPCHYIHYTTRIYRSPYVHLVSLLCSCTLCPSPTRPSLSCTSVSPLHSLLSCTLHNTLYHILIHAPTLCPLFALLLSYLWACLASPGCVPGGEGNGGGAPHPNVGDQALATRGEGVGVEEHALHRGHLSHTPTA